ncbi:hypothetical protein LAZ67_X000612 [Cordylochernes scorpioides]|uniref:Histone-lysine N-methyltransferase SETMAR n=1 Tax=Cordylochernes scorpioides TaxID=51811 RepID=A0ABY6LRR9_9ARAC|nr:hypothetical protein LAZ67_X000612 [Cordylochernes scorpioides]
MRLTEVWSQVIFNLLNHTNNGMPPGVLMPMPHSPFYQTILAELGIFKWFDVKLKRALKHISELKEKSPVNAWNKDPVKQVPYYLSETDCWGVSRQHLRDVVHMAKRECVPRALIVSNPGNPTGRDNLTSAWTTPSVAVVAGSVFCTEQMDVFIHIALEEKLLLIADEVMRQRMNSDLYCDILVNKLKPGIRNKRRGKLSKGVLFLHDNARPHTSCKTVSTIIKLDFEVLEHPAYSPDLAPSDYFLFGLLKKELKGKAFDLDEDVQKVVQDFFHTLPKSAYKEGIYKLPERWRRSI